MFGNKLKRMFESGECWLESIRIVSNSESSASVEDRKLSDEGVLAYYLWLPLHEVRIELKDGLTYPCNIVNGRMRGTYHIDNIHRVGLSYSRPSAGESDIYAIRAPDLRKSIRLRFWPHTNTSHRPYVSAINLTDGSSFAHRFSDDRTTLIDAAVKVLNSKIGWMSLRKQLADWVPTRPFSLDEARQAVLNHKFIDNEAPWERFGDIEVLRSVLEEGLDPNTLDPIGLNAMHYAWCPDVVELLLCYKADLNWWGLNMGTPLDYAKDEDVKKTMLENGALHHAAFKGNIGGVFRALGDAKKTLQGTELWKQYLHSVGKAGAEQIMFVHAVDFRPSDPSALRDCAAIIASRRARYGRSVEEFSIYDVSSQKLIGRYHFAEGFTQLAQK